MKKIIILSLLLSACAYNKYLYTDENGKAVYSVNCGVGLNFGDCFAEMSKYCPGGFNIIMASERTNGNYTDISGSANSQYHTTATGSAYFNNNSMNMFGNANTYGTSNFHTTDHTIALVERYIIYSCK